MSHLRPLIFVFCCVAAFGCAMFGDPPRDTDGRIDRALAKGDTATAIKLLGRVIHEGDAPPETYARLGVIHRESRSITGRLHSQEILTEGLREYPDDIGLLMEMGKTCYAQTFYGDASHMFGRVLQLDPLNCEAQFWLAKDEFRKWKHVQVYRDHLQRARSLARQVVTCDEDNEKAGYLLAFSLYALGDSTETEQRVRQYTTRFPTSARGYMLEAAMAFEDYQYDECDSLFRLAYDYMSATAVDSIESIGALLNDEERGAYELLSPEKRRERNRVFWVELDPDPTTALNERRLEHRYRMFLADQYFRHYFPRMRGWETERGRALVKFGQPDAVASTLEGEFTSGRMEIWTYANPRNVFTLYFRDEFLNGNYIIPMDSRFSYAAQALFLEEPTTTWVSPFAQIPGFIDLLAFRNGNQGSAVYATIEVNADSMGAFFNESKPSHVYTRVALFDSDWRSLHSDADTLDASGIWDGPPGSIPSIHVVRDFELPFAEHRLAFCLEDGLALTQTVLEGDINTARFLSDSLVLSDVLLHNGPAEGAAGTFRRGDFQLLPNPRHLYLPGQNLQVYFEAYNLRVRRTQSEYRVTYSIFSVDDEDRWTRLKKGLQRMIGVLEGPEPVISQTISRTGSHHTASENIAIDIDALKAGSYVLQIEVEDGTSGERAETVKMFSKAGPWQAASQ